MSDVKETALERYARTYSGARLLEQHTLDQEGLWKIRGEDPNCDFGGSHYQPELGIVRGKLIDIIEYAVELNNFWTWGGGGDITLLEEPKRINPDANRKRKELLAKQTALQADLDEVTAQLKVL